MSEVEAVGGKASAKSVEACRLPAWSYAELTGRVSIASISGTVWAVVAWLRTLRAPVLFACWATGRFWLLQVEIRDFACCTGGAIDPIGVWIAVW